MGRPDGTQQPIGNVKYNAHFSGNYRSKALSLLGDDKGDDPGRHFMKRTILAILFSLMAAPFIAEATLPVERTLTGCVIENTFYSVYSGKDSSKAYRILLSQPVDLKPYEGKSVSMNGWLSPGDRFSIKDKTAIQVVSDTCDALSRKAIGKEYALNYRLQAGKVARQGNFDEALAIIGKAFKIDSSDCDTYTDRAEIYCMKNDFDAVARDVTVIKTGTCVNPTKANYLLLEDLGKCLEGKGRKTEALEVYRLAYDACVGRGGYLCEQPLAKHIKRLE